MAGLCRRASVLGWSMRITTFDVVQVIHLDSPFHLMLAEVRNITYECHDVDNVPNPLIWVTCHVYGVTDEQVFVGQMLENTKKSRYRFGDWIRYNQTVMQHVIEHNEYLAREAA